MNKLRIIPLGGLEEIGRNMTIFEYDQDIVIVDMGLQFPEEDMPGIDYIIPNIEYLRKKSRNIRGVIITHGHYDHIGAIPHLMADLGNPPIFTSPLTKGIILKRQEDYPRSPKLNIKSVKSLENLKLGIFDIKLLPANHTIPDNLSLSIRTPLGKVLVTSDFRFDANKNQEIGELKKEVSEGVLALLSDSTGAEKEGHSISEDEVQKNLDKIFQQANGRIVAVTFSSLISRLQEIVELTEKYGRYLAIEGYSMRNTVEIAKRLGYIRIKKGTFIKSQDVENYPDDKITIMGTGAQGEPNAFLMRLATGEHKHLKVKPQDSIIFSSSVVPGNERTVQRLKDSLFRSGAKVFHYQMMDIHASGHAYQEDLKKMLNITRPKYFIPVHGHHYMLRLHADLAESNGTPGNNIFVLDNGHILEIDKKGALILNKKVPTNYIMVDGLGVGDVGNVVLRDRQMMSDDGMFTVLVMVDSETGKMHRKPQIISRGFVYMKDNQELIDQARNLIRQIVEASFGAEGTTNWAYVQQKLRNQLGEFLYQKTQRRPMVLPVVVEL